MNAGLRSGRADVTVVGAAVVMASVALAQIVEVNLASIGEFDVSVQKVTSFFAIPISILLMGRLRFPRGLIAFASAMMLMGSVAYLTKGASPMSAMVSANVTLGVALCAALALYTALSLHHDGIERFGRIWIVLAVLVVPFTILQVFGAFPLLNVMEERLHMRMTSAGLIRGVGFKNDPNFQSMVLVMALIFAQFHIRSVSARVVVSAVLFAGILATFSRMGLLAGVMAIGLPPLARAACGRKGALKAVLRAVGGALAVVLVMLGLYLKGPAQVRIYIDERVGDVAKAAVMGSPEELAGRRGLDSASERALVAFGAVVTIKNNWKFGVGHGQTKVAMARAVGISKVSHNTFLENLMIGGVFALLPMLVYAGAVVAAICNRWASIDERALALVLTVTFAFMANLLTITSSAYWIPLVVALATAHRPRQACGAS